MITTTDVLKLLGNKIGDNVEVNVSMPYKLDYLNFRLICCKFFLLISKS